jgi:hypothetical protein
VTINEAVMLAKRFGSEEGGKFVNGLLGSLLLSTPKADWNPDAVPEAEPELPMEPIVDEEAVEEVVVSEGTPEYQEFLQAGPWTLKAPAVPREPREGE